MNSIMQWDSVRGLRPAVSIAPSGGSNLSQAAMA